MTPKFSPLFGQAAGAYVAGRPEYPSELFDRILAAVPIQRRQRAMDLGAGTGKSTAPLLPHFREVIAVEPDVRMAEKLRACAPEAEVHVATAEDAAQEPESVDLITIATALHWMDIPRVMDRIAVWLRAGGVLAVSGGKFPGTPEPVAAVARREFSEHWNAHCDPRLRLTETSEHAVRAAREFRLLEDALIAHVAELTPRELAGFCRSTSYGAAYARSLADPEAYWRELEMRFQKAWNQNRISVDFSPWLLLARKE